MKLEEMLDGRLGAFYMTVYRVRNTPNLPELKCKLEKSFLEYIEEVVPADEKHFFQEVLAKTVPKKPMI